MFKNLALTTLLVILSSLVAHAEVNPTEPGPGDVFRAGQMCHASWVGDEESKTEWKDMDIELMTGSNNDMIHLLSKSDSAIGSLWDVDFAQAVATEQDGSVAGKVDFTCPEVNPYSAIYFYQFSSPHSTAKAWTTRFTIASPSGDVVPPTNQTQPGSNEKIPWGTGSVEDAPKAVSSMNIGVEASQTVHSTSSASKSLSSTSSFNSTTSTSTTSRTSTSTSNLKTVIFTALSSASNSFQKSDSTANFAPAATAGGISALSPSSTSTVLWMSMVTILFASLDFVF